MIVGVTGGVASGKSSLTGILAELGRPHGAVTVSADSIARELLAPGTELTAQVISHYGDAIRLDSIEPAIDRAKLARLIFADPTARGWLESVTHPAILARIEEVVGPYRGVPVTDGHSPAYRLAVAEIPLLFEAHIEDRVDRVVVARCGEPTQVRRLRERRPEITDEEALLQIRSQMPMESKASLADFVIDTDGTLDILREQAGALFAYLAAGASPFLPKREELA